MLKVQDVLRHTGFSVVVLVHRVATQRKRRYGVL